VRPFLSLVAGVVLAALIPDVAAAQTTAIQDVTPQPPPPPRPIEDRRLPGTQSTNGDAKWSTQLARQVYSLCPGDAIVEAVQSGSSPSVANDRQTGDCARNTLFVRNDSTVAIQCKVLLAYAKPDHSGDSKLEVDRVIFPTVEDAVLHSYANASNMPSTYSASCVSIPAGPMAPLANPAECRPVLTGPSPDDFYPPGSRRREEQGSVVLEFTMTADAVPADVRVAASSGFAELDTAALKYAKQLRAKSACVGARKRVVVRFAVISPG
jgi:TonB family protein